MISEFRRHDEHRRPNETYFRDSGIFRVKMSGGKILTGLSAESWWQYRDQLGELRTDDEIVISPELITYTCESFEDLLKNKEFVEKRISDILKFSESMPKTIFMLGTPLFVNPDKPRNSTLIIKNGNIVGVTSKRAGATNAENEVFEMVPEEPAIVIPGTQIALLICSDLATASIYSSQLTADQDKILALSGREELIGKRVCFFPPQAKSLVVMACWAVGGRGAREDGADDYYRYQLINIASRVMKDNNLENIMVVDRAPKGLSPELSKITPKRPYNALFTARH